VLDAGEAMTVSMAIDVYNAVIEMEAHRHGAVLVDVNALLDRLDAQGVVVDGVHLNTAFLGGLFSLDGFHPTNTSHAIVANTFIRAVNERGDSHIPLVDVEAVMAADPLVFGKPAATPLGPCPPDPGAARKLRETLGG
jgi:hypothetical protein